MAFSTDMRSLLKGVQNRVPLRAWQRLMPRSRLVINYHLVSEEGVPHLRWLLPHKTPRQFARDVEYLCSNYAVVGEEKLESPRPSANPPCSITFDDGLIECYTIVRPILRQHGVRAFFFIIAGCIDNRAMMYRHKVSLCIDRIFEAPPEERADLLARSRSVLDTPIHDNAAFKLCVLGLSGAQTALIDRLCEELEVNIAGYLAERAPYLSRDQIRELSEDGHVIGGHGIDHSELGSLGPDEIRQQIVESCAAIAHLTGRERVPFAAPFHLDGVDRSLLRRIAREHPEVSHIFGSAGVEREPYGILNRVGADDPRGAGYDSTNLPLLLRDAYAFAARQDLIRRTRRLWRRGARRSGSPGG